MNNNMNNNFNNNYNNQTMNNTNSQQINTNPATQQFQQPMMNNQMQQPMNYGSSNMNKINTNNNVKSGMNKNAIISCIFSLVSIFIFGWLAYVGLGLGISALTEIKKNKQKGIVFAIIGLVVGFIGTVLNIYAMVMR